MVVVLLLSICCPVISATKFSAAVPLGQGLRLLTMFGKQGIVIDVLVYQSLVWFVGVKDVVKVGCFFCASAIDCFSSCSLAFCCDFCCCACSASALDFDSCKSLRIASVAMISIQSVDDLLIFRLFSSYVF